MGDKYKNMDEKLLGHYITQACNHKEETLLKKQQKYTKDINHNNTCLDGGVLHLDEGRGDIDWAGIKNWTYYDIDPNQDRPFRKDKNHPNGRFETEQEFEDWKQSNISAIQDAIALFADWKDNVDEIVQVVNHIKSGKIIVCRSEEESNQKKQTGDKKLKVKIGRHWVKAVIKKGI